MEAGEYGLTRGMRFVARRPEVVAGSPGCCGVRVVCFGWDGFFRVCVCVCVCVCFFPFFFRFFSFERMAGCKYEAALPQALPHLLLYY